MLTSKYRPKSFAEIVGQDHIVSALKGRTELPHLLFVGYPGTGKTTLALVLAKEYQIPIVEYNASDERGIDFIRNEIKRISKISGKRIIFLDEADNLTPDAQDALRRTMETTKAIFILSGNAEHSIIDPIKSRCSIFHFKPISDNDIIKQLLKICTSEGITVTPDDKAVFVEIVRQAQGDLRSAINTLEKCITPDKKLISPQIPLNNTSDILKVALEGDFDRAKNLLEELLAHSDSKNIILNFYKAIETVQNPKHKIKIYMYLAESQRALKIGCNPVIELVGFVAHVWLVPHLTYGAT